MIASLLSLRRSLIVAACALAVTMAPAWAHADDAASDDTTSAQAAPADKPADTVGMPGMPGCGVNGTCCGTCQEKAAEAKPAEAAAGGCPCQRAKRAQQGAQGS
jgi:hypothetical protein